MNLNYPSDFQPMSGKHKATDAEIQDLVAAAMELEDYGTVSSMNVAVIKTPTRIYVATEYSKFDFKTKPAKLIMALTPPAKEVPAEPYPYDPTR